MAAWKLYRYAPLSALRALDVRLPSAVTKLTHLLVWASRFGSTMLDAGGDPEVLADRSAILAGHLVVVSEWLYSANAGAFPVASAEDPSGCREQLGILWCNAFAPLLRLRGPLAMDYSLLLQIARSRSLPNPGWPSTVAALCRLVHNVYTPEAIEVLQDPRFWSQVADGADGFIPSDISNTLVTCSALPPSLQGLLLFPPRPMTVELGNVQGPYINAVVNFIPQLKMTPPGAFDAWVLAKGQFELQLRSRHSDLNAGVQVLVSSPGSAGALGAVLPLVRFEHAYRAVLSLAPVQGRPAQPGSRVVAVDDSGWGMTCLLQTGGLKPFTVVLQCPEVAPGMRVSIVDRIALDADTESAMFQYSATEGLVNGTTRVAPLEAGAKGELALHINGSILTFSVRSQGGRRKQQSGSWILPTKFHIAVEVAAGKGSCIVFTQPGPR